MPKWTPPENSGKRTLLNANAAYRLITIVAVAAHLYLISRYSINLPFSDDFDQQFARLINYKNGVWSFWQFLFEQHNEHRISTTHVLTLLSLCVLGEVNIKFQIIVTSLFLLAIVFMLGRLCAAEHRLKVTAIAACFLLLPNASTVWLGGSLQYYTVVLFGSLSLILLRQLHKPLYFIGSISFFYLAMFSMASGIVMLVPAAFILLLERKASALTKLVWVTLAVICLVLFFTGYQTFDHKPSIFYAFTNPSFALQYFLLIMGGPFFGVEAGRAIQFASAALITVFVVILARLKFKSAIFQQTPFYVALYVFGIVCLVVAGRVGFEEWETALSARYQVYVKSVWLIALVLLVNLKAIKPNVLVVLLALSVVYFSLGAVKTSRVLQHNQIALSTAISDFVFGGKPTYIEYGSVNGKVHAANTMKSAMTHHYFHPTFLTAELATWSPPATASLNPNIGLSDLRFNQYRRFTLSGDFSEPPIILLTSQGNSTAYQTRRIYNSNRYELLINEHKTKLADQVSLTIADRNLKVAELTSQDPKRLAGSLPQYAKRTP